MTPYAPDEIEVRVVTIFTIKREAWQNEYGIEPADVVQDVGEYYGASQVKEALEVAAVLGPLVPKLDSVTVLVGKGPRAISTGA